MLNSRRIRAHNLRHLLSILEQHDGRHSPHAQFLRHIRHSIDVHLVEFRLRVLLAELLDYGGDGLAGTAPGCPAVEDDGAGVAEDIFQEVWFTVVCQLWFWLCGLGFCFGGGGGLAL